MGFEMDLKLDGVDKVSMALRNAQRTLKHDTVPVMRAAADTIAQGATARAFQHPSGLWRGSGGKTISKSYSVHKRGEYWFSVYVDNAPEAISEFARLATTTQGANLVKYLDFAYGRGGGSGNGRILWAAADDLADSIVDQIQAATDVAAKDIEKQMGEA